MAHGVGFKKVADEVHAMGLKFGIHVMHGVPLAAKTSANVTVLGHPDVDVWSLVTDTQENCAWNKNWSVLLAHDAARLSLIHI